MTTFAESAVRRFHFTVDVDWIPGSSKGLAALTDFCARREIRGTWFVAGRFADRYPSVVSGLLKGGHEVGTHGWEHGLDPLEDFATAEPRLQQALVRQATDATADATGVRPTMFRAPNLRIGEDTIKVLAEEGYCLDSSVPAGRYDFGYGQCNRLRYFAAPRSPYHPSTTHLARCGDSPVLEVAPSAYACVPVNMSALRVLGRRIVSWAVRRIRSCNYPIVFYAHPSEFVAAQDQQLPPDDPRRYRNGLGPHHLTLLDAFMSDVLALGYRPGLLSRELHEYNGCDHGK